MQVAINGTLEILADELGGCQVQLVPTYEIDIKRIQICQQRFQSEPAPPFHTTGKVFTTPLGSVVNQRNTVGRVRNLHRCSFWRELAQIAREFTCSWSKIGPYL